MTATPNGGGAWHVVHTPGANDADPTSSNFTGSFDSVQPAFTDSPFATSDVGLASHFLSNHANVNGTLTGSSSSSSFDVDGIGIAAALNAGLANGGGLSVEDLRRLLAEQGRGNDLHMIANVLQPNGDLNGCAMPSMQSLPSNGNVPALGMPWSSAAMSHQGMANSMPFVNGDAGAMINGLPPRSSTGDVQSIPLPLSGINGQSMPGSFGQPAHLAMFTNIQNRHSPAPTLTGADGGGNVAAMSGLSLPASSPSFAAHLNGINLAFNGGLNGQVSLGAANGNIVGTDPSTSSNSTNGSTGVSPQQQHAVQRTKDTIGAVKPPRSSTIGGSIAGTTRRTKFRRSRTGCMVCRKRKVKCDQDGLPCKQCRIGKRDCHYEDVPPKRKKKAKRGSASNATATSNGDVSGDGSQNDEQSSENGGEDAGSLANSTPSSTTLLPTNVNAVPSAAVVHQSLPQQVMLEKLRAAANGHLYDHSPKARGEEKGHGASDVVSDDHRSTVGKGDQGQGNIATPPAPDHWTDMSNFTLLGGSDEWNITTPSTGATSVHTADGDFGPSNTSSRRETLSDETLIGDMDGGAKGEANGGKETSELDSLVDHLTHDSTVDVDTTIDVKGNWNPLRLDMMSQEVPPSTTTMFAEQR